MTKKQYDKLKEEVMSVMSGPGEAAEIALAGDKLAVIKKIDKLEISTKAKILAAFTIGEALVESGILPVKKSSKKIF